MTEDEIGNLEYRGNSVSYIHSKMKAYGLGLDKTFEVLAEYGFPADGEHNLAERARHALEHYSLLLNVAKAGHEQSFALCIERAEEIRKLRDALDLIKSMSSHNMSMNEVALALYEAAIIAKVALEGKTP